MDREFLGATINTDIRIFFRVIGETIKGIKRSHWMNLVIISTMAAILSIFGCLFRSGLFVSHFVDEVGNAIQVSVYVKPGHDANNLVKKFSEYKNIEKIKIITREEAWKDLKTQMDIPEINNPLPDTIRVKLKDKAEVKDFIKTVKNLNSVEDVQYAEQFADKVMGVGHFINIAAIVIVIALGGLTFSIINNTIHLVIESRKKEIEIMRMMGVSDWYIKAPYIFQGIFYGFCGAFFAVIPLIALNSYIKKFAELFYIGIDANSSQIVVLSVLFMGIAVGALGSIFSVKKYLKV
ncbi:MAG TPA: permease-like cell division protein FtsX [Candidatus Gastranaerophilales bacterium]|nr:permease-like cell division protein FtsX [Candidatus Gastranaerophilales bacterium]